VAQFARRERNAKRRWRGSGEGPRRMINFIVPSKSVLCKNNGAGKFGRQQTNRAYQAEIAVLAATAMGGEPPLNGPLEVNIRAEYAVPRSWLKKKTQVEVWETKRNDTDRTIKLCMEAMQSIVFTDEAQVASLFVKKVYGPYTRLLVSVRQLDQATSGMPSIGKQSAAWLKSRNDE